MRSVDTRPHAARTQPSPGWALIVTAAALLALTGGCALLEPDARSSAAPLAGAAAAAAPASAATSPAAAPKSALSAAAAGSVPGPAPDAGVQRDFDAALRALRAGRDAEATRALEALARAHPELGGVHANLALVHRRAGRDAEAVSALEQAVKLSPRQPVYFNQLGIAYRHAGRFVQAREAYEAAIALDGGYAAPQLNLAILFDLYLGERARAAEWYRRSAALLPADSALIGKWLTEIDKRKPEASMASANQTAARREKD